jgi:L-lactate dehydrogenase
VFRPGSRTGSYRRQQGGRRGRGSGHLARSGLHLVQIIRAGEESDLDGSDIIVITAGLRRQPDEPRLALINRNVGLFDGIMASIQKAALPKRCILIVVTNPVDILTQVAVERSGFSADKVLGLGTVLDTLRFRSLLAQEFQVDPRQVSALILGEHGDSMVPVWSTATVNGVPLTSLKGYDQQKVWQIFVRAQNSGAEVLKKKAEPATRSASPSPR